MLNTVASPCIDVIVASTEHLREFCDHFTSSGALHKQQQVEHFEEFFLSFLSKYLDSLQVQRNILAEIRHHTHTLTPRARLNLRMSQEMVQSLWCRRASLPKRIFRIEASHNEVARAQNKLLDGSMSDSTELRVDFFNSLKPCVVATLLKRTLRASSYLVLSPVLAPLALAAVQQYDDEEDVVLEPTPETEKQRHAIRELRHAKLEVSLALLVSCMPDENRQLLQSLLSLLRHVRDQRDLEMDSVALSRVMNQALFPLPHDHEVSTSLAKSSNHSIPHLGDSHNSSFTTAGDKMLEWLSNSSRALEIMIDMEERLFMVPKTLSLAWDVKVEELERTASENSIRPVVVKTRDPSPSGRVQKLFSESLQKLRSRDCYKLCSDERPVLQSLHFPVIKSNRQHKWRSSSHERASICQSKSAAGDESLFAASSSSSSSSFLNEPRLLNAHKLQESFRNKTAVTPNPLPVSATAFGSRKRPASGDAVLPHEVPPKAATSPKKPLLSPRQWFQNLRRSTSKEDLRSMTSEKENSPAVVLQKVVPSDDTQSLPKVLQSSRNHQPVIRQMSSGLMSSSESSSPNPRDATSSRGVNHVFLTRHKFDLLPNMKLMTFISRNISRSQSLDEIRLYSVCKPLHVELSLVSEELQQKCEENEELKRYVHEINHECLELHAEVFEEANKQVQEAMAKQATAEALLQCSAAENARLREQVVQLQHQHHKQQHHGLTKSQKNKRRRSVAVMMSELLELVSPSPHSPLVHSTRPQQHGLKKHPDLCPDELSSLDSGEYHEFVQWLQAGAPVMSPAAALELRGKSPLVCPFLVTVTLEDIVPCIRFHHTALTQRLLRAFPSMHFSMQSSLTDEPCPLVLHQTCDFQLVFLEDSEDHTGDDPSDDGRNVVNISKFAKNRIDAVCAFFCFVNSLCEDAASLALPERQQELFAHIQYLRRAMCLARLGFPVANWDADQDEEIDEVFSLHRSNAAERQRITV